MKKSSLDLDKISNVCIGCFAIGSGAYLGYCSAKGISLDQNCLDKVLAFGPAIVQGTKYGIIGNFLSVPGKNEIEQNKFLSGALPGFAVGGIVAGIDTFVGYCAGYFAGKIFS